MKHSDPHKKITSMKRKAPKQIGAARFAEDHVPGAILRWPTPPICTSGQGQHFPARDNTGRLSYIMRGVACCTFGRGQPTEILPGQPCERIGP